MLSLIVVVYTFTLLAVCWFYLFMLLPLILGRIDCFALFGFCLLVCLFA